MTRLKFCGLQTETDVDLINKYKPDYAGFILAPSKRQISKEKLAVLAKRLHPVIPKVGVFVNEDPKVILEYFQLGLIDIAQLHGDEDTALVEKLGQAGVPLWKAIRVDQEETIKQLPPFKVQAYVFDAFTDEAYGGSGKTFNHKWLKAYTQDIPYFIAGGVTSKNVSNILSNLYPYGVDISSGLEVEGHKDESRIQEFLEAWFVAEAHI